VQEYLNEQNVAYYPHLGYFTLLSILLSRLFREEEEVKKEEKKRRESYLGS
jgi:hypothetical protein